MGSAFHLYARVSKQKDASTLQKQNRFNLFSKEYIIEYEVECFLKCFLFKNILK
jgi:hypothetical protein